MCYHVEFDTSWSNGTVRAYMRRYAEKLNSRIPPFKVTQGRQSHTVRSGRYDFLLVSRSYIVRDNDAR